MMEVVSIDKKMRNSCLRQFGHVQMRAINTLLRKGKLIQVESAEKDREITKIKFRSSKKKTCQLRMLKIV